MSIDPKLLVTAREAALGYLDRRMHSRFELSRKLRQKGIAEAVVEAALDELASIGLIDDAAFARAFTSDRVRLAPRGYALVGRELRGRGIAREVAAGAARAVEDEYPEIEVARAFAATRERRLAAYAPGDRRERMIGWLSRRGFRSETVFSLVDEMATSDPMDDTVDETASGHDE